VTNASARLNQSHDTAVGAAVAATGHCCHCREAALEISRSARVIQYLHTLLLAQMFQSTVLKRSNYIYS
jgi:hypothetical protein